MSPSPAGEGREALLALLQTRGVLRATAAQPLRRPDGTRAPWMLDTLSVSLTADGARLAAEALLERLSRFEGRQIATYGTIGLPLLQSVVLQSGGRYRGLVVRKERKAYGSGRLVEGPLDVDEPVIVVDDSIVSGYSTLQAVQHLEAAGLRVEGAVFLVRFGFAPGVARLCERGLHVEWVYDAFRDLVPAVDGIELPTLNPTRRQAAPTWADAAAPEGLHPAALARLVLEAAVWGAPIPRPPASLAGDWDATGGAWVSVRDRKIPRLRHARKGFWCLPGEPPGPAAAGAVVEAASRTAEELRRLPDARAKLDASVLAVTFFGALESVAAGEVDNERYGLLVRSRERPMQMGGALPRMPGIRGDWAQLRHARRRNAGLSAREPYEILRHDVTKVIEPGAAWPLAGAPRAGAPWAEVRQEGGAWAAYARRAALARAPGTKSADDDADLRPPGSPPPATIEWVFLTIHYEGRLVGCAGSRPGTDGAWLRAIARAAWQDPRCDGAGRTLDPERVAVGTSFLYDGFTYGPASPADAAPYLRLGRQALAAFDQTRTGVLLSHVAATHALSQTAFFEAAKKKARIDARECLWRRYECASWISTPDGTARADGGLPCRDEAQEVSVAALAAATESYLRRQVRLDGRVMGGLWPHLGTRHEPYALPRLAHAAWVLARSDRVRRAPAPDAPAPDAPAPDAPAPGESAPDESDAAPSEETRRVLSYLAARTAEDGRGRTWVLPDGAVPSVSEVAFSLLAWAETPPSSERDDRVARLAATLAASIDRHGQVATHREPVHGQAAHLDYLPGQALLALARAQALGLAAPPAENVARALRWLRHRSRFARGFGQIAWVVPALVEWWRLRGDRRDLEAAFELCDWALWHQRPDGAFLTDQQPDPPGFTTGVYVEGIAAAIAPARAAGDEARAARYEDVCRRAFRFIDRLMLQPRDRWVLPDPEAAFGGVRQSLVSSFVRTDYVQHALSGALTLGRAPALAPARSGAGEGGREQEIRVAVDEGDRLVTGDEPRLVPTAEQGLERAQELG